jgi:hypothetical protein
MECLKIIEELCVDCGQCNLVYEIEALEVEQL